MATRNQRSATRKATARAIMGPARHGMESTAGPRCSLSARAGAGRKSRRSFERAVSSPPVRVFIEIG
mgnify:FL=1